MTAPAEENLVCRCYAVPERVVLDAIRGQTLRQVEEVTAVTRAGGGCSSCWDDIQAILDRTWGKSLPRDVPDASGLSSAQKRALIVKVLEGDLQRLFDLNGLQAQLVDVHGERVLVRFFGSGVGTTAPSYLAIKYYLVRRMSEACGHKVNMVELNVLESRARTSEP
jgi:NifU-like protein